MGIEGVLKEGFVTTSLDTVINWPKVMGHREPVFDQLITVSRLVVTKPSLSTPSMPILLPLDHSQSNAPFFHS